MSDYPNLTELDIKGTWPHQDIKELPVWRIPRTNLRWLLPGNVRNMGYLSQKFLIERFWKDAEK